MKRLLKHAQHIELEIIAVLNTSIAIAATTHEVTLEYRDMKPEYVLTKDQLIRYKSFLTTVASAIVNSGFEIVDEYQSKVSYSYYIQFTPTLYDGISDADNSIPRKPNSDIVLDVKFRLSDHYKDDDSTIRDSIGRSKNAGIVFSEFVVGGVTHDSIQSAISDIKEICNDLKFCDYSRLL